MLRRGFLLTLPGMSAVVPAIAAEDSIVSRRVGRVLIQADTRHAFAGGFVELTVQGAAPPVLGVLEGRRVPLFSSAGRLHGLVPLSLEAEPGSTVLGVEIRSRGRVRIPVRIDVRPRAYGSRTDLVPLEMRPMVAEPERAREGRLLLEALRTRTAARQGHRPFRPPVSAAAERSFGLHQHWVGGRGVESVFDATWGQRHRGVDYPVPVGTAVHAPAAGTVVMSRRLGLPGEAVVVDHGQAVVSLLCHLSRRNVYEGQRVAAGGVVGLSGQSGLATRAHVHWGVYVHGIAVDPGVLTG